MAVSYKNTADADINSELGRNGCAACSYLSFCFCGGGEYNERGFERAAT